MRVSRFHEEQIVRLQRERELSGQTVASQRRCVTLESVSTVGPVVIVGLRNSLY